MRNIWWILGLGGIVWIGAHAEAAVRAPLTTAFNQMGAHPTGYSVNDWVELSHDSTQSLTDLALALGTSLHVKDSAVKTRGVGYTKVTETAQVGRITTSLIVERLNSGDTFFVLNRTSPEGFIGLPTTEALFQHVLAPHGTLHQDINLEGVIAGKLSPAQQQDLIHQGLSAVGASVLNGIRAPGYISDAGKSPFISSVDDLESHSINIQIATSYNTYLRETQVYVGTPLVTVTY